MIGGGGGGGCRKPGWRGENLEIHLFIERSLEENRFVNASSHVKNNILFLSSFFINNISTTHKKFCGRFCMCVFSAKI